MFAVCMNEELFIIGPLIFNAITWTEALFKIDEKYLNNWKGNLEFILH